MDIDWQQSPLIFLIFPCVRIKGKPLKKCLAVFVHRVPPGELLGLWVHDYGSTWLQKREPTYTLKEVLKKYLFSVLVKIIQMFLINLCLNILCNILSKWIFFFSNWNIVDLQLCASFWNTPKWFKYPLWFMIGSWIQSPVVYNRTLFFTHSVYNNLHLLVSKPQSIIPSPLLSFHNH